MRSRGGFTRTARKDRVWQELPNLGAPQTVTAASTFLASLGLSVGAPAFTVARVRGKIWCWFPVSPAAAQDAALITVALGVIPTDLYTTPGASLPDPRDDGGYPWLYWTQFALSLSGAGFGVPTFGMSAQQHDVDAKAMRKIKNDQTLVWIAQYTDMGGAPDVSLLVGDCRMLLLS